MAIKKESVHGFQVVFEEEFRDGIRYLRDDLQFEEARTIFDAARLTGYAFFEDDADRDWTVTYNRGNATYILIRRQHE